jgi:hypothetical protein
MAKYKCATLGDCDRANAGEVFERAPGEDTTCPGCNMPLELQAVTATAGGGKRAPLIATVVVAVLAVAGGVGYWMLNKSPVAQVAQVATAAVAVADAARQSGIAPSDAETKAARIEGDQKLANGEAADAEQASSKAAANEMLKLAIAKMSQGKLDEAEKDLLEARARAPKQPLVYYDMAILRLKQGRSDDALKEFESSFAAGFSHFDLMEKDTDLDQIRKAPAFAELIAKYRK